MRLETTRPAARVRRLATLSLAVVGLMSFAVDAAATRAFAPTDGRYRGEYTSGNHGPGKLRLRVEALRPGLHGVRLLKWSGELRCEGAGTREISVPMTAARVGRTFSGFVTINSPPVRYSFTGRFTAKDALRATVRVTQGTGAERCDTGPIKFVAHRTGP
jgi:hypothetical protein